MGLLWRSEAIMLLRYRCPQQITIHTAPSTYCSRKGQQPQAPTAPQKRGGQRPLWGPPGRFPQSLSGPRYSTPELISKSDTPVSSLGQESAAESQRVTGTGLEPGGRPPRPFSEPQFLVGSKSTGSGSRHTADPTPYLPKTSARHHQLCGPLFPHLKNGGDPAFLAGHCEDSSCLPFLT